MYTPEFQVSSSYMKNKISESSIQNDLNKIGFNEKNDASNNSNDEIKLSNQLSKTEEINEGQDVLAGFEADNYQSEDE